jgi:hypothetical protein
VIRYALSCDQEHAFESWFQNSDAYDRQAKRGLVACPVCGSTKVEKALMAPRLNRTDREPIATQPPASSASGPGDAPADQGPPVNTPVAIMSDQEREFRSKLKELRDHLTRNSENVGTQFPEKARQMHYGEIEHRSIHGVASPDDAKQLHEEGIGFLPLPILPDERN